VWLPTVLILLSATLHVSWNMLVKRGGDKLVTIWTLDLVPPVLLWPLLLVIGVPGREAWSVIVVSAVVHAAATVALVEAYERADLSVAYPVARGLAPVLVAVGAALVLGERLSLAATAGVLAVSVGVVWLGLSARRVGESFAGLAWAAAMAALIATYSIVDKIGVTRAHPVGYAIVFMAMDSVLLTPYVLWRRGRRRVQAVLWEERRTIAASSLLGLIGYLLILVALRLTEVSYVATLREISVVLAAIVGWRVLKEPVGAERVAAATLAAAGLITLSLGHGR
jgi:drug/metabolite transporter (DMT)-like permease